MQGGRRMNHEEKVAYDERQINRAVAYLYLDFLIF